MSPPLSYQSSCVPRAIAALLGRDVADVSAELWGHRLMWWPSDVAASPSRLGTPTRASADYLVRTGRLVEEYHGSGRLDVDARMMPAVLSQLAQHQAGEVRRTPTTRWREDLSGGEAPEPEPELRTLHQWMELAPVGLWIFYVISPAGTEPHAVAVSYGRVRAGDSEEAGTYGEWPVYQAHRIIEVTS